MNMTQQEHSALWNNAIYKSELQREDAMDCFHSIITMVEKYFIGDDLQFASWMHVNFEILRNNFNLANLLGKIIVIQEYIENKSFLNENAFISIHETIQIICDL